MVCTKPAITGSLPISSATPAVFRGATRYRADGSTQDVTVWCSNDYLGMGQNPLVTGAMKEAIDRCGAGRRRHPQHLRNESLPCASGA